MRNIWHLLRRITISSPRVTGGNLLFSAATFLEQMSHSQNLQRNVPGEISINVTLAKDEVISPIIRLAGLIKISSDALLIQNVNTFTGSLEVAESAWPPE